MERVIQKMGLKVPTQPKAERVAAYARVSSGKDAMLHSLSAQVSYYSDLIQNHPGWLYCGVFADEALTGTKENRTEFQRLLAECRAGSIDLIITKSISRFARNTVVLLQTVRELKSLGVDVYFEEQNIHSVSADGELMLTILASYAQEESLSASENQKWRIKKNFEEGMPWSGQVLGYKYVNGVYIVKPEEAEIVRNIFTDYLSGMGIEAIMLPCFFESYIHTEEEFQNTAKAFRYCCELAQDKGVDVYVESILPAGEQLRMVEELNMPNLYVFYDTQNYDAFSTLDQVEMIQAFYPYMGKQFHVKDGCGTTSNRMVGEGSGKVFETLHYIREKGFSGWIISENFYDKLPIRLRNEADQIAVSREDLAVIKRAMEG